jgi:hypothetical protein
VKRDQLQLERSRGELHQSFANWCSVFLRKKQHPSLQKTAEAGELKTRVKELETSLTTDRARRDKAGEQLRARKAISQIKSDHKFFNKIVSLQTEVKTLSEQLAESRSAQDLPDAVPTCVICFEDVVDSSVESETLAKSIVKMACGHSYHLTCILPAFTASGQVQCPQVTTAGKRLHAALNMRCANSWIMHCSAGA